MALGFGFNKAKVLASAEKFVQQGKLQNAIAEYEKVTKEDPKDLTVLNTIGDLYARVGQNDQATHYFKRVGDQYAQNGFTVKAIAIYKKLTKLSPGNTENITKLAELYTQQGLFNDARVQYMQIADGLLRSGDHSQAARIFQRILELDPENSATQAKLADLYMKIGRRDEARNIYYNAAEALYARGSLDAAEEALDKVIKLDPNNAGAMLLRGMIAADSTDSQGAVQYLEQVKDLDSRPQGLRALLRAKMNSGSLEGADAVAEKLLTLHQDVSGLNSLAEWYVTNQRVRDAVKLYERNFDRMAGGSEGLRATLYPLIDKVRDNPEALNSLTSLLERAGDSSHTAEAMELQAHAFAQKADYARARDLYKKLAELEPENSLHAQNYRQMLAKLGEDSATRILSPEEAAQAFMVEELDDGATVVHQKYDPPTENAIEAALTDAELFVSYNVPSKAIPPLEAALPLAPHDVALNQRLATLYARAERFADAARVCQTLSEVYRELGHEKEAAKYQEAARKYGLRAPAAVAPPAARPAEPPRVAKAVVEPPPTVAPAEPAEPSVKEFSFDVPEHIITEPEVAPLPPAEIVPEAPAEFPLQVTPVEMAAAAPQEIDVSDEWENMLSVETEAAVPEPAARESEIFARSEPEQERPAFEGKGAKDLFYAIDEKVEEIRFYIAQHMWEPAKKAILAMAEVVPDAPQINELMAAVSAGQARSGATRPTEAFASAALEPAPLDYLPPPFAAPVPQASMPTVQPEPVEEFPLEVEPTHTEHAPMAAAASPARDLQVPPAKPARTVPPAAVVPIAASSSQTTESILTDFIHDLEQRELADFVPRQKPEPQPAAKAPAPVAKAPIAAAAPPARPNGAYTNGGSPDADAASVLNDILADLQEETAEAAPQEEDPETHYNLGIAFKEMGLLEEAIGELQKVCHAVDRGSSFSQPIQAFTWLAQCLVDKGAPEAAVRWYQKALQLPGLDDGSRCAIYYDLGSAYEAFGDRKSALANFMEVYGSNIDFRDVASRIKTLKS